LALVLAGATLSVLAGAASSGQPNERSRAEMLAKRAGERLVALQRDADLLAAQERTVLNDLRKLELDRQIRAEQLKQAEADLAGLRADLTATESKMASLQATEQAARPELRSRLVEMYKLGQARYARVLLSTPDLRQIGQAARTVAVLARLDRDRVARYQETIDALRATRSTLEERERQATGAKAAAEQAQAALARATQAKNDLVRDIDRRRDLNAQLSAELQTAQQKLQLTLRESGGSPGGEIASGLPLRPFKGDLAWPVAGQLRRRFGGTSGLPGSSSNGIEVTAEDGSPVSAIHDGVVAFAGSFSGFGNLVILDHGSQALSLYGDLLEVSVAKGTRVDRGQPVGSAGPLPSGGTGLYFELRIDGHPVDPLQWLQRK
jgi:septal ring factor EnvC (AmiA/AmiB activator)